jgi:hypothetical protein
MRLALLLLLVGLVRTYGGLTVTNQTGGAWSSIVVTNESGVVRNWVGSIADGGSVDLDILPWSNGALGFIGSAETWEHGVNFGELAQGQWTGRVGVGGLEIWPASTSESLFNAFVLGFGFGSVVYAFRWQLRQLRHVGGEA